MRRLTNLSFLWSFLCSRAFLLFWLLVWLLVSDTPFNFAQLALNGQGSWYADLISNGYQLERPPDYTQPSNLVFFPLYPFLVASLSWFLPLSPAVCALILSNLFLLAALLVGINYYALTRLPKDANPTWKEKIKVSLPLIFLFCFGFNSFYFSLIYPESLWLLLVASGFYLLERHQYYYAGLVGLLLSATNPLGIFFSLLLISVYTRSYLRRQFTLASRWHFFAHVLFLFLLSSGGFWLYSLFLFMTTGDAFAYLKAQAAWGSRFLIYVNSLHADYTLAQIWWLSLVGIIGFYLLLWAMRRQHRYKEIVFAAICLFLPLSSSLWSLPRQLISCFPFLTLFADSLKRLPNRLYKIIFYSILAALNIIMWLAWLSSNAITR